MIYSTPSALSVTWHTIAGVTCARLCDPAVVNTGLRPVVWLHGRRPDAQNLWGEIAAWTTPAILPGALWAILSSGRTAMVPWLGHHYGHDAAGLDDARALLAEVGPVDLIGYSMGGLGACALSSTDPEHIATITLISPCVDLVACLPTLDPAVAAEARAVWAGAPDASDAAVTAALEAVGRDPVGLAAGFAHADRCLILAGTNDPHLGDTVATWAAAAGVPAEARYLSGPGGHYDAAALDPEWDDIMPLRLAVGTADPDPPDPEPVEPFVTAVLEDAPDLFVRFAGTAVDGSGHERALTPYGTAGTFSTDPALGTVLDNAGRAAAWLAPGYHLPSPAVTLEAVVNPTLGGTILSEFTIGRGLIFRTWEGRTNIWQSSHTEIVGPLLAGSWWHLVYQWNGSTARVRLNNGDWLALGHTVAPNVSGLPGVELLALNSDANTANRFDGLVHSVAVYPTVLSDQRIAAHWEALGLA